MRRTALLYQKGNFVGREYFHRLCQANRKPDVVVAVGEMTLDSVARENQRCGGLWNPPAIPQQEVTAEFESLREAGLWQLLKDADIEVAIQGGVGILKAQMLSAPRIGFVNVHPGRLPAYRGNSCPEWAVLQGAPVVATAHFIDSGIDTGPVITASEYAFTFSDSYERFRAGLYAHCAAVLIEAFTRLDAPAINDIADASTPQPIEGAHYYPPIPAELLAQVKDMFRLPDTRRAYVARPN